MAILPFPQDGCKVSPSLWNASGVLWLHGLSGSGKSTLARNLSQELTHLGVNSFVLDGDSVRRGLNRDLGLSPEDRKENVRRTAEVARLMAQAGVFVIAAFITPYEESRHLVRATMVQARIPYAECHVSCPLSLCMYRDPKGLYARARAGEVKGMTGLAAPFEEPGHPDLTVNTQGADVHECVHTIVSFLRNRHMLVPVPDEEQTDAPMINAKKSQDTEGISSQQVV
ncbi:MAG: adenylyl-sulfate kinase [Desulfovibrio sp.]|nr:MAG: adenylyl-sulfate kinase [Desulfovibrio sp.]